MVKNDDDGGKDLGPLKSWAKVRQKVRITKGSAAIAAWRRRKIGIGAALWKPDLLPKVGF